VNRVLGAVAVVLSPACALAQSPEREAIHAVTAAALTKTTAVVSGASVEVAPRFTLEGSASSRIATGQIGIQTGDFTLTAGASTPIGSSTDSATLADLDGLRNKTTGSGTLLWSHWAVGDVSAALTDACSRYAAAIGRDVTTINCDILALKRTERPEARAALDAILNRVRPGAVVFATARGRIAPESFHYVTTALDERSEHRTSWSAGGSAGALLANGLLVTFTYTRQVAYEANGSVQICEPFGAAGALSCDNRVVGPPVSAGRSHLASFELRRFFSDSLAISPRVTYDVTRSVTGVQLPIYFLRSADGLTGGVTLGWRSDSNAFVVSATVGAVLGLITTD